VAKAPPEQRNLFTELEREYVQPKAPRLIEVGPARYLAVDGRGGPGGAVFQERIGALHGMAYTMKFQGKEAARAALRSKEKPGDFDAVRLERIEEGRCVPCLHVGPYETEAETVERMDAFCEENALTPHLWHHEVYLGDPRRVPPERLKTILRRPVEG